MSRGNRTSSGQTNHRQRENADTRIRLEHADPWHCLARALAENLAAGQLTLTGPDLAELDTVPTGS
jgi:hypothetical protein